MIWTHTRPPVYQPDAILTKVGWVHPRTGELLICMNMEWVGPGRGLKYSIPASACIQNFHSPTIEASARIDNKMRQALSVSATVENTSRRSMSASARIVCATPIDTGINPSWSSGALMSARKNVSSDAKMQGTLDKILEMLTGLLSK